MKHVLSIQKILDGLQKQISIDSPKTDVSGILLILPISGGNCACKLRMSRALEKSGFKS
jgi:hypothetical protein